MSETQDRGLVTPELIAALADLFTAQSTDTWSTTTRLTDAVVDMLDRPDSGSADLITSIRLLTDVITAPRPESVTFLGWVTGTPEYRRSGVQQDYQAWFGFIVECDTTNLEARDMSVVTVKCEGPLAVNVTAALTPGTPVAVIGTREGDVISAVEVGRTLLQASALDLI